MSRTSNVAAVATCAALLASPVRAHGVAGAHLFASTLLLDDANAADEASLPTFMWLPQPSDSDPAPTTVRPPEGTTILRLDRDAGHPLPKSGCASATPDALAGWEFLVDTQGWLRVAHGGESGPDWNDPAVLTTQLRTLRDQPITSVLGGTHVHEH